jgi:hypothetical protein
MHLINDLDINIKNKTHFVLTSNLLSAWKTNLTFTWKLIFLNSMILRYDIIS